MFTTEMLKEAMEGMHVGVDLKDLVKAINGNAFANGLVFGAVLVTAAFGTWQICEIKSILKKMEKREEKIPFDAFEVINNQTIIEETT